MGKKDIDRLYNVFKEQAEAVSARVYRVKDPRDAGRRLTQIFQELNVSNVITAQSDLLRECLGAADTGKVTVYAENLREHSEDAHLGLSEADLAIAETGTLVQDSTALEQRLVSTLPPVHVALVRTGRLVEHFVDALELLNHERAELTGYIAFISGPSRTADIERVLTIGVHGPEQLHIIFVDRPGGEQVE